MTYRVGTIAGTIFQDLVDRVVDDAVALGYACVESRYVHGLMTYAVLKNPSSLNYFGGEFHFALGYSTTDKNALAVHLFENWNTSSKMATAYAPALANSWGVTNSYTHNRPAAMLNSAWNIAPASQSLFQVRVTTVAAGDAYHYSIDNDRLMLLCIPNSTTAPEYNFPFYVGAYERFLPSSSDPVPIMLGRLSRTGADGGGFKVTRADSCMGAATREPSQSVNYEDNFSAGWYGAGGTTYMIGNEAWTPAAVGAGFARKDTVPINELYSGKPFVSRVPVTGREQNGIRGLFKGVYIIGGPDFTSPGGTFEWTFAGNTYAAVQMSRKTGGANPGLGGISMEKL